MILTEFGTAFARGHRIKYFQLQWQRRIISFSGRNLDLRKFTKIYENLAILSKWDLGEIFLFPKNVRVMRVWVRFSFSRVPSHLDATAGPFGLGFKTSATLYTPNIHVIINRIFSNWSKRRPWPDLDATQRDNRWIPVKNTVECSLARRRRRKFSFIFCVTSADVRRCDLSLFTNVSCSLVHLNSLRTSL